MTPALRKVTIDIVSDTVCPWCYVGKRRLEKAMSAFRGQLDFEVRWHAFQLNPVASEKGEDKLQMYRNKFGPQVDLMIPRMVQTFADVGLKYSIGGLTGNTFNSHRIIHWAGKAGGSSAQDKVVEELFNAYFCQEKFLNDPEVLLSAVESAGLSRDEASAILNDPKALQEEVQTDMMTGRRQGITGVPFFTIDGKYRVSGAQPPQEFMTMFEEIIREVKTEPVKVEGQTCTVGGECL